MGDIDYVAAYQLDDTVGQPPPPSEARSLPNDDGLPGANGIRAHGGRPPAAASSTPTAFSTPAASATSPAGTEPNPGPRRPPWPSRERGWQGWRPLLRRDAWAGVLRPAEGRVVAGVATALAERLDVEPLAVRVAFVAFSFVGGAGIALYMAAWLALPPENALPPESDVIGTGRPAGTGSAGPAATRGGLVAGRRGRPAGPAILGLALADRRTLGLAAAVASGIVAVLIALGALGDPAPVGAVSPGVVALAGLVAVWRHAGPEDREAARRLASLLSGGGAGAMPTRRRLLAAGARVAVGLLLVAVGTSRLLGPTHLNRADIVAALSALGIVAGFGLVLAPWWLRLGRELVAERRERARAEQKAEMAAHLHDSVLQTLALIQRSANDPQQVQRLARAQERQLRSWLFDRPEASGAGGAATSPPCTVSTAFQAVQQEVEADHGIRVEVVSVGDAPLDEALVALVAAAREAVVNAAKWSGAEVVSVYSEVDAESASVFVRDRGRGFDPSAVPKDRKGLSESVCNRMRRNGGTSSVKSAPGEGTEVVLKVPTRAGP